MAACISNSVVSKYSYNGATSLHLLCYSDVLLAESPDAVIIHAGTNDIWGRNKRIDKTTSEIAINIFEIAKKCKLAGVRQVIVSGVLKTRLPSCNKAADEINKMLKIMCENNDFIFVNNSDLEPFLDDAVHLNWEGRRRLVNKYIKLLNN